MQSFKESKYHSWFIAILLATLLSGGCASSKGIKKVSPKSISQLLKGMGQRTVDFTWFSAKARVKFNGEEARLGGRSNIRMIKDSVIWMNFKKLSLEGSRMLITQDSFWILYRFDNIYESGTLRELLDAYHIDLSFSELQNYIVGNFLIPPEQDIDRFESNTYHELQFNDKDKKYEYLLRDDFGIHSILLQDTIGRLVEGVFDGYDENLYAREKKFFVKDENGQEATISFKFSSIEFDIPKKISFEIPKHYKRIPY